jgi:exonuclease VII small subunit
VSLTNSEQSLAQANKELAVTNKQVDTALLAYQSGDSLVKAAMDHIGELRKLLPQIITLHEEAHSAIAAAVIPAQKAYEHLYTADPNGASDIGRTALPAARIVTEIVNYHARKAADSVEVPERAAKLCNSLWIAMSGVTLLFEFPVQADRLPQAIVNLHETREIIQARTEGSN